MIHPLLTIPYLVIDAPGLVALTMASLVATAPDPALPVRVSLGSHATMAATAPNPVIGPILNLSALTVVATAPAPNLFADFTFMVLDTAQATVTAPDPLALAPTVVAPMPALVNLNAPDPYIDYGFVVSSTRPSYAAAPSESPNSHEHRRQTANVLNRLMQGKGNTAGTVTLLPNVTKTYLRDARLAPESVVQWDPMTANAVTELLVNGTFYVLADDRQAGQWLLTHANAASTDRTYRYTVSG